MTKTKIEWTEATWNPVTGCTKMSAGCQHGYAERMAGRLRAMGQPNYAKGFRPTTHEKVLSAPLSWKRPQMVFVNSMGDFFFKQWWGTIKKRTGRVLQGQTWDQLPVG